MTNTQYVKGKVSVIIPTYKRSDKLSRAVDSVINQTYNNIEVIIVDDNIHGDEYSQQLHNYFKSITDIRVRLITQNEHINGAAARNAGIRAADGEFITFLDDDDWIEPVKFEHQLRYLESKGDAWGAVSCLARSYKNGRLSKVNLPYKEGYLSKEVISRRIRIGTSSPLLRRTALDSSGYFDERLKRMQDIQLFAEFCNRHSMCLLKEYLYNRDIDDKSNQPSIQRLVETKNAFFDSISEVMNSFTKNEQKRIYAMTKFDMAYNYWNAGEKKTAINNALTVLRDPIATIYAIKRIIDRFREVKLRNYYNKKYGDKNHDNQSL